MSEENKTDLKDGDEEAPIAFTITGVGLDLDLISRRLDVTPTHSHKKGDLNMIGKPYPHDMWLLNSDLNYGESLNNHLLGLAKKLQPHYEFLRFLKQSAEISVYCGLNSDSDQCGFSLTPEALELFTELGINMEVSVLF